MDATHLARAQTELNRAHQSLDELGAKRHPEEIAYHWASFLVSFERIFTRLQAAAGGRGDAWFGKVEQYRKADPLLSYLLHARNADEHGLKAVVERRPGFIREVAAELVNPNDPRAGVRVTLERQDPHVALIDVTDRGIVYPVPTSFRGQTISAAHPLNVGLLGLSYADEMLAEARSRG
jgi:hypothetical protein